MKKSLKFFVVLLVCVVLFCTTVSAAVYDTYNYTYSGDYQISPDAYVPEYEVSQFGEAGILKGANDIIYDKYRDLIFIVDSGNNRILVTDTQLELKSVITNFVRDGVTDSFNSPSGVFVTEDGYLYVADTNNGRVIILDSDFNYYKELPRLSSDILPSGFSYNPVAVSVDGAKNVYVVSKNTNMGVISLDPDGRFEGFIGAQKVAVNPLEMLWRMFMSEEQLERSESYVSVEFSNITIDAKGFLYVTCSDIDRYSLYNAIWSRSGDSKYAPIKKLNPAGTDVLRRTGFFPPVGDINFSAYNSDKGSDPSQFVEVTLMENGMYMLADSTHNKLFVYDSNGNLLYAFGGTGELLGQYNGLASIAYNGNKLYVLDSQDGSVTVSQKTEYGLLIDTVIGLQDQREFEKANETWNILLSKNNNFDMAYQGLGRIALENGEYKEAMEYFKLIDNKIYYNIAFKYYRENILDKYGLLFFLIIFIMIFLLVKLIGKVGKYNNELTEYPASGKLKDELIYSLYVMRHPFKGFWGLKMEHRGSIRAANIFILLTGFSAVFTSLGACYLQRNDGATIISALSNIVLPLFLVVISNMCFTSLMDGKGTVKDVYMAVSYSTVPYILVTIPTTLISYFLITDELGILSMVVGVATVWMALLIFLGLMSVHDYSFGKNIAVCILTVIGIAFILFVVIIFVNLGGRMLSLVTNIISEVSYRS